jgi:Putative MetA-pathway of phenol degradation
MRKVCLLLLALALVPRASDACSMCHCGDPTFTLIGSQLFVPKTWHVGLDAGRYDKDQVSAEDPGTREQEVEDRLTFAVSRTFGSRLTLVAQVPFSQRTITTDSGEESQSGLSDPALLAHYRVYSGGASGSFLSLSLGLRTGWGVNDAQVNGERAEEHLQPGSGAGGVEPGLSFSRVVREEGSVFGSLGGRFNGRNDAGYRYGSAFLATVGYERKLGTRLNAILEANFRSAAKDEPEVGETDPNTGGSVLYVAPRLLVKLERTLFLRVGVQIPVVKDLYGDQDEKVNVFTGLTVRF